MKELREWLVQNKLVASNSEADIVIVVCFCLVLGAILIFLNPFGSAVNIPPQAEQDLQHGYIPYAS